MRALQEQPYHRFVFDVESRRFVGNFEDMYAAEDTEGFSAWNQDDLTHPVKRIALAVLESYTFRKVIDIGCGRGAFTHLLKKENTDVLGLDVSPTAVRKASLAFPEIRFLCHDLTSDPNLPEPAELVVCLEVLSYLSNWRTVLSALAKDCEYLLLSLWIPPDPIGFVEGHEELLEALQRPFQIDRKVIVDDATLIVMARSLVTQAKKTEI